MGPLVASTSRKLTTHSVGRVESREFTVVVFPISTLVNIFDGADGWIVAESKISFTYLEHRLFTPVSRQKKILGTLFVRH
jgi:hypothetical protein